MRKYVLSFALVLIAIGFTQCNKNAKWENELEEIAEYLEANNITAEPTYSGMYYIETLAGTGPQANGGDEVSVRYRGTFLDGSEFDSGTFTFTLGIGQVIRGWDEGIKYMKEGGKAQLIIPSNLAYGPDGRASIPGYSTLLFDVELLDIK